jgi:hypothetical protein
LASVQGVQVAAGAFICFKETLDSSKLARIKAFLLAKAGLQHPAPSRYVLGLAQGLVDLGLAKHLLSIDGNWQKAGRCYQRK